MCLRVIKPLKQNKDILEVLDKLSEVRSRGKVIRRHGNVTNLRQEKLFVKRFYFILQFYLLGYIPGLRMTL